MSLGGRAGIRTLEGLAPLAGFEAAAFVHSATLPFRTRCTALPCKLAEGEGFEPPKDAHHALSRFQDGRFQPLSHPSVAMYSIVSYLS